MATQSAASKKAAIVKKLLNKGMSPKQANAFATQAVKRSAAKKKKG